jgi:acyl-phosphate glycerol 3-phosphate acyltransferase
MNIYQLLLILFSYLYGSIPFALVIGKLIYKVDVRDFGSGNLGGSNTGRVLGKKAGLACIILDISKCFVCVLITQVLTKSWQLPDYGIYLSAVSCVIGHCYPIFANFKGGKAASVMFGYALAKSFFAFAVVGIVFLVVLKICKYVSLASIIAVLTLVGLSSLFNYSDIGFYCNVFIAVLLIYRHRANIVRIKNKTENKISWL